PYYVFAVTDPIRTADAPDGQVFEGANETNNAKASAVPMLIELPPPSNLQVDVVSVPTAAQAGAPITIQWTVTNYGANPAAGVWSDAIYLSQNTTWDLSAIPLAHVQPPGSGANFILRHGESYTSTDTILVPPLKPGTYRAIVRTDVFNEVNEGADEADNQT